MRRPTLLFDFSDSGNVEGVFVAEYPATEQCPWSSVSVKAVAGQFLLVFDLVSLPESAVAELFSVMTTKQRLFFNDAVASEYDRARADFSEVEHELYMYNTAQLNEHDLDALDALDEEQLVLELERGDGVHVGEGAFSLYSMD